MARRPEYQRQFTAAALEHLGSVERKYHSLLQRTMIEQLTFDPAHETRNRKPLLQPSPFGASWELRCGPQNRFRILYRVIEEDGIVEVVAIGSKDGNRLLFSGVEFQP